MKKWWNENDSIQTGKVRLMWHVDSTVPNVIK